MHKKYKVKIFSLDEICDLENALNVSILQYEFA